MGLSCTHARSQPLARFPANVRNVYAASAEEEAVWVRVSSEHHHPWVVPAHEQDATVTLSLLRTIHRTIYLFGRTITVLLALHFYVCRMIYSSRDYSGEQNWYIVGLLGDQACVS